MAKYRIWKALIDCEGMVEGCGHVCGAKKGKTCPIPPELEYKARRYMVPADEVEEEGPKTPEPSGESREDKIKHAMKTVAVRNNADEFVAATGLPKAPVLTKELGFRVRTEEVQSLWPQVLAEAASGNAVD